MDMNPRKPSGPRPVELLKGYTRVAPAIDASAIKHEVYTDWHCKRGNHGLCPCTRLALKKTGEITREFRVTGEPQTQIVGMSHCLCLCHTVTTPEQETLVAAVKLVCPIECIFDEVEAT